jgi:hypothetical protein
MNTPRDLLTPRVRRPKSIAVDYGLDVGPEGDIADEHFSSRN